MPPNEVAEAKRLHDGTEHDDRLFVDEGVVEGHADKYLMMTTPEPPVPRPALPSLPPVPPFPVLAAPFVVVEVV
jgi:hypothetical protein